MMVSKITSFIRLDIIVLCSNQDTIDTFVEAFISSDTDLTFARIVKENNGCILLYNTDDESSFICIEEFVNILEFSTNSNIRVCMIGIASEEPTITYEAGFNLASEYGFYFHVLYEVKT